MENEIHCGVLVTPIEVAYGTEEEREACNSCYFRDHSDCRKIDCMPYDRDDNKSVAFQLAQVTDMNSIDTTLAERGTRYGSFGDHAIITQNIKRAMAATPNWATLSDDKKESLEMLAHKIGRILNGDPNYHDSWHDIVGYAKLVADDLLEAQLEQPCATYGANMDKLIEPTEPVELTRNESSTLCNLLMASIFRSGGTEKQPPWVLELYTKLAVANGKLRGHS